MRKPRLIALIGDSISVDMVAEEMQSTMWLWETHSFRDKIKDVACLISGLSRHHFDNKKLRKQKVFLRNFQGTPDEYTELLRVELERFNPDFGIEGLFWEYNKNWFGKYPKWIITGTKTKDELEFIRLMDGIVVRVGSPATGLSFDSSYDYIIDHCLTYKVMQKDVRKCLNKFGLV